MIAHEKCSSVVQMILRVNLCRLECDFSYLASLLYCKVAYKARNASI